MKYRLEGYYNECEEIYVLFVPDLPGCFADGETLEEAEKNADIVIEEWIELAKELGREIPEASKYDGERIMLLQEEYFL